MSRSGPGLTRERWSLIPGWGSRRPASTTGCCCNTCESSSTWAFPSWWVLPGSGSWARCWPMPRVTRGHRTGGRSRPRWSRRCPLPPGPGASGCTTWRVRWTRSPSRRRGGAEVRSVADRIALTGLKIRGNHGVFDEEKRDGQDFLVDITVWVDLDEAAATDDLKRTVDYGEIAQRAAEIVGGPSC